MPVVTVVMIWDTWIDQRFRGTHEVTEWNVKVNGLSDKGSIEFQKCMDSQKWLEINNGKTLLVTPQQIPRPAYYLIGHPSMNDPPMDFVTECRNILSSRGYKVVSSHQVKSDEFHSTSVWTLQF